MGILNWFKQQKNTSDTSAADQPVSAIPAKPGIAEEANRLKIDRPMQEELSDLLKKLHEAILKPCGFKKDGKDFRLIQDGELGKIVNFQSDRYNDAASCRFTINAGVYFESGTELENQTFKEYECQIRQRPAVLKHSYGKDTWWTIDKNTDPEQLQQELECFLNDTVLPWLDYFPTKAATIQSLLNGEAQKHGAKNTMHYDNAKLLTEMGYGSEVLPHIINIDNELFQDLVKQIKA